MIDFPVNPTVGQSFQVGNTIYKCVSINPAVWSATIATAGIPDASVDGKLYGRKDGAWSEVSKATLGLGNVDNTSDANKPISTATAAALAGKEPTIAASSTANYWRGDKTFQALNKAAVGLGNVDNTADSTKSVSFASNSSLAAKASTLATGGGNGAPMTFNWSGQGGQPTWLWGSSDGTNHYVYNPSNFSVNYANSTNYANSCGNADTVDGQHAGAFPLQDNCAWLGFASGHDGKPYMRYQNGGTIRQLIWQTTQSNEPWSIRDAADGGGRYLETSGTAGAFGCRYNVSDERLKNNIVPSTVDAISIVKGIRFVSFDWASDFGVGVGHVPLGFNAQNLQSLSPDMVTSIQQPENTPLHQFGSILQVHEGVLAVYLAKALQDALLRIEALEARP